MKISLHRTRETLMTRIGRHELPLLVLPGIAAAAIWTFVELADDVSEGDTRRIDRQLLLALRNADDPSNPIGPLWMEEVGRDITAFGGTAPLVFITLMAVLYLLLRWKRRTALFVLLAVGGGQLLSSVLKFGFDRPRPDLVPHGMDVYTASFPSGHAMMSAVTYLTLGALLARIETRKRIKAYLILVAVTVTVLVGVSRVYLGVHWPTDVLGGWMAGSAWAAACWTLTIVLQRRGRLEQQPADGNGEAPDGTGTAGSDIDRHATDRRQIRH
ncbi:MAG TPA: phosphatase PAP2 family protein [Alphaproteobacteria bacterium]|nr:phosphatase PAP2 family protein [Alphaproteobacteria bacterium]